MLYNVLLINVVHVQYIYMQKSTRRFRSDSFLSITYIHIYKMYIERTLANVCSNILFRSIKGEQTSPAHFFYICTEL